MSVCKSGFLIWEQIRLFSGQVLCLWTKGNWCLNETFDTNLSLIRSFCCRRSGESYCKNRIVITAKGFKINCSKKLETIKQNKRQTLNNLINKHQGINRYIFTGYDVACDSHVLHKKCCVFHVMLWSISIPLFVSVS